MIERYMKLGAANCHPIYNGLDPETHHPVPADPDLCGDVLFVGNRLPDRERRVEEFFFRTAELTPEYTFILGGEGWAGKAMPKNVRWIGHVSTDDHNRLNCSARFVLNINRDSMADVGFSPPTRVFEAAGAGACLITDQWTGIEMFFAPDREILVARNAEDVAAYVRGVASAEARQIAGNMRQRALAEHTYKLRARQFNSIIAAARERLLTVTL